MRPTRLLLVPLLALVGGCYFGKTKEERPWSAEAAAKIEVGKTTKAEVLRLLGPPKQIVRLLESEAYMYTHTVQKETGTYLILINLRRSDTQFDSITVIINRQDVVTAVGSRFSADEAGYGFPWQD
jgi:outer membrane protein assembly factor BamE (lipoprotein component of BamABCDE complex)